VAGLPVVTGEQFHTELEPAFEIVRLREFRFDEAEEAGPGPLAWSIDSSRRRVKRHTGWHRLVGL